MAKIKTKYDAFGGENYLANVNGYIHHKNKKHIEPLSKGAYGVDFTTAEIATQQMMQVKEYFGKTGDNPISHIMVCYSDSVKTKEEAIELTEKCAQFFKDDHQLTHCTHGKDEEHENYHGHLGINTVNYNDGKLFRINHQTLAPFKKYVSEITGEKCSIEFWNDNENKSKAKRKNSSKSKRKDDHID